MVAGLEGPAAALVGKAELILVERDARGGKGKRSEGGTGFLRKDEVESSKLRCCAWLG